MRYQFPSRSAIRDQKRKDREFEEAARRERYEATEKAENWEKYQHLDALSSLDLSDESVRPLLAVVRYLLERIQ
jgi:hypothetical protein